MLDQLISFVTVNEFKFMQKIKFLVFVSLLVSILACNNSDQVSHHHEHKSADLEQKEYRDSSTILMAKSLQLLYRNMNPEMSNYRNKDRADIYFARSVSDDLNQRLQMKLRGAFELVNAGLNDKAIAIYNDMEKEIMPLKFSSKNEFLFKIIGMRAVAYFRKGELDNCLNNHNSASCIVPFQEQSYHQLRSGSENAINDIMKILKIKLDPNFIYLLNLAYMTLGEYPDKVPNEYLVPLTLEEKNVGIKRFENIGSLLGVDDNQLSGGIIVEDFNGDGLQDIIASSWSLEDDLVYYINNGDGSYTESHILAGLKGITGGLNLVQADYNNDGHMDFLILRGAWLTVGKHPNSLIRNNGDGTFSDVTIESGILSQYPTQTATWADFNNDGHLDLFIGNESFRGVPGADNFPCELFLSQKNGTFRNVANEVNANVVGWVKGVAAGDPDNDGDQDLFISVLNGENVLLRNDKLDSGIGYKFTDISEQSNISLPLQSFPTWFFDYNNDGLEDIFVASYSTSFYNNLASEYLKELKGESWTSESPKLYRNNGNNTFSDVSKAVGLNKVCFTMGSSFGDFNNDGFLDIYLGTGEPDFKAVIPNRAFLNIEGRTFSEVTTQAGLGHVQKGHAISFADMDGDGDQDIYAVMGGAFEGDVFYNALFENPGHGNDFVKVKLVGTKSNRMAIGAKVKLELENGSTIHRTVSSGSSFGSTPSVIEIGIKKGESISNLQIKWPSGLVQDIANLELRKLHTITEGSDLVVSKIEQINKFKLDHEGHHHHH